MGKKAGQERAKFRLPRLSNVLASWDFGLCKWLEEVHELGYLHAAYSNDPKLNDQQSWARKLARTGFFARFMVLPASCSQA